MGGLQINFSHSSGTKWFYFSSYASQNRQTNTNIDIEFLYCIVSKDCYGTSHPDHNKVPDPCNLCWSKDPSHKS